MKYGWGIPLGAALAALVIAACGGDGEDAGSVRCDVTPVDTGAVPRLADGVLRVGSSVEYPPLEFYDVSGRPIGLDIDLLEALAAHLCVEVEIVDMPFAALIDALEAREFDVIMSAMTITEERSQRIDFVPYANVGASIIVRTGNPAAIHATTELCGRTVAVQAGTIHEDFVHELNTSCGARSADPGPIDVLAFDLTGEAVRDVVTAGSDATLTDFPAAFVFAEGDARLELVDVQICPQPYGIGVPKGATALNEAMTSALRAVDASGDYDEAMKTWDLSEARLELSDVLAGDIADLLGGCGESGDAH